MKIRRFYLNRQQDHSGVSGTGNVAEGVEFSNGMCAITWITPYRCVTFWNSIKELEAVHGHEGDTVISWLD